MMYRLLLVSTLVCATSLGCKAKSEPEGPRKGDSKEVVEVRGELLTVARQSLPETVRVQGSLIADNIITLSAKVPGRIEEVLVDLGDAVTEGQPLFRIDTQEYAMMIRQSESQLAQARAAVGLSPQDPLESLNPENAPPVREARAVWTESKQAVTRIRDLAKRAAISETDLEIAEAAERVAEAKFASAQNSVREKIALIGVQMAQLELAKQRLIDATTIAPANGIIQSRAVSKGTYVQTGQALCVLVENQRLRFRASVPERYAYQLAMGQTVRLLLERTNASREVKITRISPAVDLQSRSLLFEAEVDNRDQTLRPGLFAEADVILNPDAEGLAIPLRSVVRFAGVDKVWKIVGGKVLEQPVLLGRQVGDQIEILKGIAPGDRLLQQGNQGRVGIYIEEGSPDASEASAT